MTLAQRDLVQHGKSSYEQCLDISWIMQSADLMDSVGPKYLLKKIYFVQACSNHLINCQDLKFLSISYFK